MDLLSLTVRDAAGALQSQIDDSERKRQGASLSDEICIELKALICIDARTVYLALLEFLSLRYGRAVDCEEELVVAANEDQLPELAIVRDVLQRAMSEIKQLGIVTPDPYLESVELKASRLSDR